MSGPAAGAAHAATTSDVVCLGESMVTFLPSQPGRLADVPSFGRAIGGAESNVACALAAAGHRAKWVSRVGADGFGEADRVVEDVRFFQPDDPTACTNTSEIAGGALALPRYRTAIACEPAAHAVVVNVAVPDTMADEPSSAAPS